MPNRAILNRSSWSTAITPLFSRLGTVVLIIMMVVVFFSSQLIGVYLAGRLWLKGADKSSVGETILLGSSDGTVVSVSIIISSFLIIAITTAIIGLKKGNIKNYLALSWFSLSVGISMFGLLLVFMIGSQLLSSFLEINPLVFIDPLYQSVSSVWLFVFAIVIAAPIYEEVVFRGILWSAIAEQFSADSHSEHSGAIVASIVTSLVFAVIHLQYGGYEISTIVVLALIFSYARFKSGSLILPILLHIINNGVAMGLYLYQVS